MKNVAYLPYLGLRHKLRISVFSTGKGTHTPIAVTHMAPQNFTSTTIQRKHNATLM